VDNAGDGDVIELFWQSSGRTPQGKATGVPRRRFPDERADSADKTAGFVAVFTRLVTRNAVLAGRS
jgi:hypothetical protein